MQQVPASGALCLPGLLVHLGEVAPAGLADPRPCVVADEIVRRNRVAVDRLDNLLVCGHARRVVEELLARAVPTDELRGKASAFTRHLQWFLAARPATAPLEWWGSAYSLPYLVGRTEALPRAYVGFDEALIASGGWVEYQLQELSIIEQRGLAPDGATDVAGELPVR